jgi:hypothetical protein
LISRKSRDSLAKSPSRTVTRESRPLDLDLVVQIWSVWDLITAVQRRSGGSGWMRRGRRRGATPATFPAAALGKTRRSSAISRLQGLVRGGVWPGMITETCVIHPRLLLGAGRAGAAVSTAEAARRSPSSSELGAWAPRARQGLRDLAHRGQGVRAVLTGGRGGRRRDAAARRRGTTAMA